MNPGRWRGAASALVWLGFPLVPALLGSLYHEKMSGMFSPGVGGNPRDWNWFFWLVETGPLIGFGFLAGATLDLPDEPGLPLGRRWFSRRSLWVAVAPWAGALAWLGVFLVLVFIDWAYPASRDWPAPRLPEGWWSPVLFWIVYLGLFYGVIAFGWLPFAGAALRRAGRLGRLGPALMRGLGFALGFVGSLFGSFWAITEVWRSYFFDPRIVPLLLAASTCALVAGCAAPETLGEVRRRELFDAMLVSWLLGLALAWRWWSRSRSKPKPPGPPA